MTTEFEPDLFYEGQLPTTKTALYTVASDTAAYVKQFSIFNTNAVTQTVLVYVNFSGTSRLWRRYSLTQNESAELLDQNQVLVLPEGAIIEAQTTTASAVDCFILGVLES